MVPTIVIPFVVQHSCIEYFNLFFEINFYNENGDLWKFWLKLNFFWQSWFIIILSNVHENISLKKYCTILDYKP
jgi:hypothetical protein